MNFIDIYTLSDNKSRFKIEPAPTKREYLDQTSGFAYNCLPLNIANQYGWVVNNPEKFTATWDGCAGKEAITIATNNKAYNAAQSHFGFGVLTISVDFIIKTSPNISIYIRGFTNHVKENLFPMDAIVETDWLPFTFTFNYQFHNAGSVTFEKDEPLFMFFPVERKFIESFEINYKDINMNKELKNDYEKYSISRSGALAGIEPSPQRFYRKGSAVDDIKNIVNHQTKINIKPPKSIDKSK